MKDIEVSGNAVDAKQASPALAFLAFFAFLAVPMGWGATFHLDSHRVLLPDQKGYFEGTIKLEWDPEEASRLLDVLNLNHFRKDRPSKFTFLTQQWQTSWLHTFEDCASTPFDLMDAFRRVSIRTEGDQVTYREDVNLQQLMAGGTPGQLLKDMTQMLRPQPVKWSDRSTVHLRITFPGRVIHSQGGRTMEDGYTVEWTFPYTSQAAPVTLEVSYRLEKNEPKWLVQRWNKYFDHGAVARSQIRGNNEVASGAPGLKEEAEKFPAIAGMMAKKQGSPTLPAGRDRRQDNALNFLQMLSDRTPDPGVVSTFGIRIGGVAGSTLEAGAMTMWVEGGAAPFWYRVAEILPGSLAQKAGLKSEEWIVGAQVELEGVWTPLKSFNFLDEASQKAQAGHPVKLYTWDEKVVLSMEERKSKQDATEEKLLAGIEKSKDSSNVAMERLKENQPIFRTRSYEFVIKPELLGVRLGGVRNFLLSDQRTVTGLWISEVFTGSRAAQVQILPGDVIFGLTEEGRMIETDSPDILQEAVSRLIHARKPFHLHLARLHQHGYVPWTAIISEGSEAPAPLPSKRRVGSR